MANLTTFLWFDGTLGEALDFYADVFDSFSLTSVNRSGPGGLVVGAEFSILGYEIMAMGWPGSPPFSAATSLFLSVDGQDEVDKYWDALTRDGGTAGQCGWLTDKFGLSWQVIPVQFGEHTGNSDPAKSSFAWTAMRSMSKIVIADLYE